MPTDLPLLEAIGVVQKVRDVRPPHRLCMQFRRLRAQIQKRRRDTNERGAVGRGRGREKQLSVRGQIAAAIHSSAFSLSLSYQLASHLSHDPLS